MYNPTRRFKIEKVYHIVKRQGKEIIVEEYMLCWVSADGSCGGNCSFHSTYEEAYNSVKK